MARFRPSGRTILILVLALSLLGNALAIGAGLWLHRLRVNLLGEQAYSSIQSPEVRHALSDALVAHKAEIAPALRAVLTARIDAMKQGTTLPFDRDATAGKMEVTRLAIDHLLDVVQVALLDGLENHAADQAGE